MPKITPEQFARIVKAAADARGKVKNVRVSDYSVIADIVSRSGKSVYQYSFTFDDATGLYNYRGGFESANEPVFFAEAIQKAMRGITGT